MPSFKVHQCKWHGVEEDILSLDWYISEVSLNNNNDNYPLCRLQQGGGHCCGSTFIGAMSPLKFAMEFNNIINFLSTERRISGLRWPIQDKVFFYLSDETVEWDVSIRKHPKVKEVYYFMNGASKPYSKSLVTLFVLELA